MKKIVGNLLYDTEKATEITHYSNGHTGYQRYEETLYKTENGRFFLYGAGGPMSPYCVSHDENSFSGSENIIPISGDELFCWLVEKGEVELAQEYFGKKIKEA